MRYRLSMLLVAVVFAPPMLALTYEAAKPLLKTLCARSQRITDEEWEQALRKAKAVPAMGGTFISTPSRSTSRTVDDL